MKNSYAEEKELLTNVQRLMDIINNRIDNGIRKPVMFPDSQQQAANYWIQLLEKRMQHEKVENNIDPYQERLVDCLVTFYKLPHKDQQQIILWSRNKIMWRGDSMKFMRIRAKVTPEMAIDRAGLMRTMHSMCR